jgi:integrase
VNLTERRVWFTDTKNGEDRGVPLNERVFLELTSLARREGAVFRRPDDEPYARRIAGSQIDPAFKAACRRAGLAEKVGEVKLPNGRTRALWKTLFSLQDLRHTWATWFSSANRDLRALMERGGWKSERMVMRFRPDSFRVALTYGRGRWLQRKGKDPQKTYWSLRWFIRAGGWQSGHEARKATG